MFGGAEPAPHVLSGHSLRQIRRSARTLLVFYTALLASLCLRLMFPDHATLGATLPRGDALQSFVLEILLTCLLMFVILSVSTGAKEKGITAGIAVGSVIGLEALFAGPISGASMNPVRSLAPAVVSLQFTSLWVYLTAPTLGAVIAVFGCRCVHERPCCCPDN